ncbi:hypothetical protein HMPREF1624_01103 [Sporothrix schenckii ATCC 58251]|uniref:C3H1-type domain-containing protein n=1 Tax=Sporothrix schenckii (strain ATCC 58251 / de Perez 2211183) TaxID=1391915 RepID=U7Q7T1_SPOS1|nr:hypothetical protein HMPREF1624_01103 [Sporothrix schenckii ATCC 58251]
MPVEITMQSPLAEALQREVQKKLAENGWAPSDDSDNTMAEYIILMLVNGRQEDEISGELARDLLNLDPEDNSAREFSKWLFETVETQNATINGPPAAQVAPAHDNADQDVEMDLTGADSVGDIGAPTGPKAMRSGSGAGGFRGGRDKRVVGQINRQMDRSNDSVLHRVRGQGSGINTHARGGPHGRGGMGGFGNGRQPRHMNGRATASFNHALANAGMGGGQPGMPWVGQPGQPGQPGQQALTGQQSMQPGPMDVYAMLEQQSRMMMQMQQQMQMQQNMMQNNNNRRGGMNNRGRPLADRIQRPHQNNKNFRNGQQDISSDAGNDAEKKDDNAADGESLTLDDFDMNSDTTRPETSSIAEAMCKFNLNCANENCKFAHQSPAAPPGITVNVQEACSFGAACKNKKCTARHPSPAARAAHQSEQDCKFFPNCTNPHCQFRHPAMPLCRNGADCSVRGCKFTHIQTMCKFRPCTNRYCTFKHEEGQRGTFPDKVWTADGSNSGSTNGGEKDHISERKFVDESAPEETILPGVDKDTTTEEAVIS